MAETEPTTISSLDYFQPLGFGATFGRVFQVFKDRWMAFTTIAFVVYVVGWLFAILLNLVLGNDINIDGFSSSLSSTVTVERSGDGSVSTTNFVMQSADEWIFYLIEVFIYYVFTAVAHGASIWIVAHWYVNQHPFLLDAFDVATGKCWTLVGATLLLTALSLVGAIPMVLAVFLSANIGAVGYYFGAFVMLLWIWILSILTYITYVAVMVEGKGPWGSIRRSFGLTKGYWCEVLGLVLVWVLVKIIIGSIIGMILYSGIMSVNNSDNYFLLYFGKFLDTVVGIFLLAIAPV